MKKMEGEEDTGDDGGLNYCFPRVFSHLHGSLVLSFILSVSRSLSRSAEEVGGGGRRWEEGGGA